MSESSRDALMAGLARSVPIKGNIPLKMCEALTSGSVYSSTQYSDLKIFCQDHHFLGTPCSCLSAFHILRCCLRWLLQGILYPFPSELITSGVGS